MKSAAALPISERGAFMARPMKNGLDYFPFDVDFFSDRKIKRLRAAYGADGVNVYIYLLCEIYRNGYYTVYDDDLVLDVSDELSIKSNLTTQILNYLFSRSLLQVIEGRLAEPVKVITAASVQRRYQAAKKGAKRDIDVAARFWVLSEEDTEDFIRLRPEGGSSGEKTGNSRKNPDSSREEPTKESKEKQSILLLRSAITLRKWKSCAMTTVRIMSAGTSLRSRTGMQGRAELRQTYALLSVNGLRRTVWLCTTTALTSTVL